MAQVLHIWHEARVLARSVHGAEFTPRDWHLRSAMGKSAGKTGDFPAVKWCLCSQPDW